MLWYERILKSPKISNFYLFIGKNKVMQIALGKSESDEALKNLSLLSCHVKGIEGNQSSPLTNIHYRK